VKLLIKAMEIVDVPQGENIINQGETKCDYFYIIEKGSFTVIVDKKEVATLNEGTGFGELALVYNTPRQATCKAATNSTVFALDRKTFKIVMTNGFESKHNTILDSLKRFRLLSNLTPEQLDKLADTVEIVHYQAGNVIIRKGVYPNISF
jgi:cAMP-dependent protein kinase regulator